MKKLLLILSIATFAISSFADNGNLPTAERIASELIGLKISETRSDGFFKGQEKTVTENDKIAVSINDVRSSEEELICDITIDLITPTRGHYIIDAETRYYKAGSEWVFDIFFCRSIMPKITNAYNECVTIEHKGHLGERFLLLKNHSNVVLAVYLEVKYWLRDEFVKIPVKVNPNSEETIGGLFVGDVEEYRLHYIERY